MKVFFIFLLLILYASIAQATRVISFNLHCAFDSWEERITKISKRLSRANPDVISFQEVCENPDTPMPSTIVSELEARGYKVRIFSEQYSHRAWDKFDEKLVVISKHPVEKIDKGFLPTSPLQRSYLALKIEGTWYVNTHLEFRDDYAHFRQEQIKFLINRFLGEPQVIMGDFNSEPNSPEHGQFRWFNYTPAFPAPTYPSQYPILFLDGFWSSPELIRSVGSLRSKVVFGNIPGERELSDHLGVELDF